MKRFVCFWLILLLALGCLSGCGASDDTQLYQAGYDQGLADAQSEAQEQLEAARAEGYAQAQADLASDSATADQSEPSGTEFARGYESGLADLEKVSQAEYEAGYRDGTSYGLQTALEIIADETGDALSSSQEESSPVQVVVGNITQVLGSDTVTGSGQTPQAPTVTAILSAAAAEQDHQAETAYATQTQEEASQVQQVTTQTEAEVPAAASVTLSGVTVYVTASGTKYHTAECSYLKGAGIAMDKAQAEADGYSACSRCKP